MKYFNKNSLVKTNPYLKNAKNLDYILAKTACSSSQVEGIFITPERLLELEKIAK